jgi:hypothetical protein
MLSVQAPSVTTPHKLAVGAFPWLTAAVCGAHCHSLQALQQMLEVPQGRYPLTRAVVNLTTLLLAQQSTWGPVPSLVGFTLHRWAGQLANASQQKLPSQDCLYRLQQPRGAPLAA